MYRITSKNCVYSLYRHMCASMFWSYWYVCKFNMYRITLFRCINDNSMPLDFLQRVYVDDIDRSDHINMCTYQGPYSLILSLAHKGWGYSRPLGRLGCSSGHKGCGFFTPNHCTYFHQISRICVSKIKMELIRFWATSDKTAAMATLFTPQPLKAVRVLFSPMVSGWLVGWRGDRKKFVWTVYQKP